MELVYFGSGEFGLPTLKRLASAATIRAVVTQPDRPAGRGGKATPTPIGAWAQEKLPDVPLLKPERVSEPAMVQEIRGLARDLKDTAFVVIAFGQKMPPELLDGVFAINLHASLLPRWRGAAPINAAILAGDLVTGNSVITLAQRMDAGLVLGQTTRTIDPGVTAGELHDLLSADGPNLVDRVLAEWQAGRVSEVVQDEAKVTKASKLSKEDGWLDFSHDAERCRQRIHGLTPWPGVTVQFRGEGLKLLRASSEPIRGGASVASGTLIDAKEGIVACGTGESRSMLRLLEVQPPGKKPMSWHDFANGRRVADGETLIGRTGGAGGAGGAGER